MLTEQFKVGDRVVVKMDEEARSWLPQKYPADGTKGEIISREVVTVYHDRVGYRAKNPGVFTRFSDSAIIRWDDGTSIEMCLRHVKLEDEAEAKRRYKEEYKPDGSITDALDKLAELTRVGDLPETKFWEQDLVQPLGERDDPGYTFRIQSIDYHFKVDRAPNMMMYTLRAYNSDGEPSYTRYCGEYEMTLVERGNVYRHFNGEKPVFKDLKDEANFAGLLNTVKELRNPATGNYRWTKDEVLAALQDGTAHGMRMGSGFFGAEPRPYAIRFEDEELGERVRQETLKGFGL